MKKIIVNDGKEPICHIFDADSLKYFGTPKYVTAGNDYYSISYDGDIVWVYYIPSDYDEDEFDYMAEGPAAFGIDFENLELLAKEEGKDEVLGYVKHLRREYSSSFIWALKRSIDNYGDYLGLGKKRINWVNFVYDNY